MQKECVMNEQNIDLLGYAYADVDDHATEILITSDLQCECNIERSGDVISIEGIRKEVLSGMEVEIGSALKDLMSNVLGVKQTSIKQSVKLLVNTKEETLRVAVGLHLPKSSASQLNLPDMRKTVELFAQKIGTREVENACIEAESLNRNRQCAEEAALKLLHDAEGKVLPPNLSVCCKGWDEAVPLQDELGKAPAPEKTQVKKEAAGAFRGYFIEGRIAFFALGCNSSRKPLQVSFDEENFFEKIRGLSLREFTRCTIRYVEHLKGGKTDYLQLEEITGISEDMFEFAEE